MKDRPALAEPAVTLVSHASVLIEAGETVIWCDPWLGGKVFADSWALVAPPAAVDKAMAESTHIWISHEHPDHFHLQTLRDLPDEVKQRVTLLFQDDGLPKMPDAFRRLGFPNIQLMPHRKIVQVGDVGAYCYQQGLMNSALAVRHGNTTVININDCELTALDSKLILDDLGSVDLTLNQFSLAGYNGSNDPETWSTAFAAGAIENLLTDHERLGASVTIPFASFIYFCRQDNAFLNQYCNRPSDVIDAAATRGIDVAVLANGDTYRFGSDWDSDAAVKHWNDVFERVEDLPCDPLGSRPS